MLDTSLILYAEHDFNASTFVARATASTLSDLYSAITAAIGTLRGPLHGGANEAAMDFLQTIESESHAGEVLESMFKSKKLVMGFGHRIYKNGDPRNAIIKVTIEISILRRVRRSYLRNPTGSLSSTRFLKKWSK